ncbi:MAG: hypothetical protein H6981_07465 [Gammaproteobacteria bacterium]|nr:hypothetical protein [Gammaproteobacteria bacterium]MCP5136621.1 hypothetical protein [Gammaproteobacteria bacterium]
MPSQIPQVNHLSAAFAWPPLARALGTLALTAPLFFPMSAEAASDADIAELKTLIKQMRSDYEQRISTLESRLVAAEKKVAAPEPVAVAPLPDVPPTPTPVARANAFNPAIGLVLNGTYRVFSDPAGGDIPGFPGGEEAGRAAEGFSLGESELSFAADVDDRFQGKLTFSLADNDGATSVELEEAFLTTTIADGARVQAGRFLSGIGYLNTQHTHADDFADRPLPYRMMLNGVYKDDGLGISWVAPTDTFLEIGGEYLRGGQYPAAGAGDRGKGAWTAHVKLGDDVGISNSWQAGLSYLDTRPIGRQTGTPGAEDSFSGDSRLWVADAVWKWAPNGDPSARNLELQGEYFWRDESGEFAPNGSAAIPYSGKQKGWYAQAVYQFMPQWRIGARTSALKADDPGAALAGTALDTQGHDPRDYSLMLDWSNSEFSRIRMQYTRDESRPVADDQWTLQYIMSLGAHGAHTY